MNPEWRTAAVRALCRRMLDARRYDVLPILADALQDAGCTDAGLLAECRAGGPSPVPAERLVNLVYSDETAAAVRWLEQFVRDINYNDYKDEDDAEGTPSDTDPHDYEFVIQEGHDGVKNGHMHFGSDAGAEFFWQSEDNRREFFRNWSLVTGVPVPNPEKVTASCAC